MTAPAAPMEHKAGDKRVRAWDPSRAARASTSAARAPSSSPWAEALRHDQRGIKTERLDRQEAEMNEVILDGNAIAGLLQEVFAAEMTTAIGTCRNCGASEPVGAIHVFRGAGFVLRSPHSQCPFKIP